MGLYLDIFIRVVCYAGFFTGLWLFVAPLVIPLVRNSIQITRTRNELMRRGRRKGSRLFKHLKLILYVIYDTRSVNALVMFFIVSFGLFVLVSLLVTARTNVTIISILVSAFAGFLPYLYLQLRLRALRIESSYEAEGIITELINQYKINYFNMVEAIDKTIPFLSNCPYGRKALFRLSLKAKDYSDNEELEEAVSEFVYAVDTEWAVMLGMNIYIAISDGTKVTESLDDILKKIRRLKSVVEKDKRNNAEAFFMIRYFSITLLALSMICASVFFHIKPGDILRYQFNTGIGIKMSSIMFAMIIVNFGLFYLFRRPKYDL